MNLPKALKAKHLHGQEKYHAFSFVKDGRVMKKETIDELVDGINYQIYQLIKSKFPKKAILSWTTEELNQVYESILEQVEEMSNRSANPTIKAIARMRDIISDLS